MTARMTPTILPIDREVLEAALLARFTELALLDLFSQGLLHGTVHTCVGQELSGATVGRHLEAGDTVFSNHRCHGHFLARHRDVEALVAELMGRRTGVCAGMGGSQHLCRDGFYSNGIQGGIVPVAAGLADAHRRSGSKHISVVFIGDGTLGEGVLYEALNLASKWALPLLIVLEDNGYAQSTAQAETLAGGIGARAAAFGIRTAEGNTWQAQELNTTVAEIVQRMRNEGGPCFLHIKTFRLKAHSKGDDTRPRELVAPFESADPLNQFLEQLSPEQAQWVAALQAEVQEAVDRAAQAPAAVLPPLLRPQAPESWELADLGAPRRLVTAINDCLRSLMQRYERLLMIGEDIEAPYGGAFKVTQDLSTLFPGRVHNTPISEAAIVGLGNGLAMAGWNPFVEIMFGDFIGLAFDQLVNHAAKFEQMYAGQVKVPLVVRTPMGGGRGYGPTHSQSLEKHFLGVPGLQVLALNALTLPEQLYGELLNRASGPALVIENKQLYGSYLGEALPVGFELLHESGAFPSAWLRPRSHRVDITLLSYGGCASLLVLACERLFVDHDLIAQVICPMQIYPFDASSLAEPLASAPALLVVEEGQGFSGFGAEVLAQLSERGLMPSRCRRLHPKAHCIPSSGPLEKSFLPSVESIVAAAREIA